MKDKEYIPAAQSRPDGKYAVVRDKETNDKVFEQRCDTMEEAEQISLREYHRLSDK